MATIRLSGSYLQKAKLLATLLLLNCTAGECKSNNRYLKTFTLFGCINENSVQSLQRSRLTQAEKIKSPSCWSRQLPTDSETIRRLKHFPLLRSNFSTIVVLQRFLAMLTLGRVRGSGKCCKNKMQSIPSLHLAALTLDYAVIAGWKCPGLHISNTSQLRKDIYSIKASLPHIRQNG